MKLIIGGDTQLRTLCGLVATDSVIQFCCYLLHN